ncbi:MAG: SO_0444 family Cu/Zn efflux transporter [Opitutales bacterium]
METLQTILWEVWVLTAEMAPYLLIGFALAGLLGQLVPRDVIQRHLSGRSVGSVLKAVVFGAPLPICSCGVIPLAAGLRRQGASRGATAAFVATTPQTGVDSIAATYSLMGLPFTVARLAATVVSGLCAGTLINVFARGRRADEPMDTANSKQAGSSGCCESIETLPATQATECCGAAPPPLAESACCGGAPAAGKAEASRCGGDDSPAAEKQQSCGGASPKNDRKSWGVLAARSAREAFIALPREIGWWIVVGIVLGGLLSALVPMNAWRAVMNYPALAYLGITLTAVPLYVCATGSIPLAFGLMHAGFSPGAALVFLIAGPATNTATIATLTKTIGKRETALYLIVLMLVAWASGAIFDLLRQGEPVATAEMHAMALGWGSHLAAAALVAVLAFALGSKWLGRSKGSASEPSEELSPQIDA